MKVEKGRVGRWNRVIADIARDRKSKFYRGLTQMDADRDKSGRVKIFAIEMQDLHSMINGTNRAICWRTGRQDTGDYEV
jgi:hypothetical protein